MTDKEILKMIKQSGMWYETENYKPYTRDEFYEVTGVLLPKNIKIIQRQCDAYAWEEYDNHKTDTI